MLKRTKEKLRERNEKRRLNSLLHQFYIFKDEGIPCTIKLIYHDSLLTAEYKPKKESKAKKETRAKEISNED